MPNRISRWMNNRIFRYHYICPNGHSKLTLQTYSPGYCYSCGARLAKVETTLCPNCGLPDDPLSVVCQCGYKWRDSFDPYTVFEKEVGHDKLLR